MSHINVEETTVEDLHIDELDYEIASKNLVKVQPYPSVKDTTVVDSLCPLSELIFKITQDDVDEDDFNPRTYGLRSDETVTVFKKDTTWRQIAQVYKKIFRDSDDALLILDLSVLHDKFTEWQKFMPNILPHYAVKANDTPVIVKFLSCLGVGFDCASKAEIDHVLGLPGVSGSDIIYGNPSKSKSHILHAKKMNVKKMTFDSVCELEKIKVVFPKAKVVLRLRVDDSGATSQLGKKFGANPEDCDALFETCKRLNLNLIGISFHVGSGQKNADAHVKALQLVREMFDLAKEKYGIEMNFLDIGGGFPGYDDDKAYIRFERIATGIVECVSELFPTTEVVAEPGRYFSSACMTAVTKVITKKSIVLEDGSKRFKYYLNDGIYGSFNNIKNDSAEPEPQYLREQYLHPETPTYPSTVYGPTCDSIDVMLTDIMMPELQIDDYLYFENMGAYTSSASSTFNGFPHASIQYIYCGNAFSPDEEE